MFVLGLIFGAAGFRLLAWQITAFTVAHSVTLFLATEDVISVSPAIVEPLIAVSIAIVAAENLLPPRAQASRLRRVLWRPLLVFCFGLLHGLGFAGVLADLGLPAQQRLVALVGFNLGIEAAQLAIVLLVHTLLLRPLRSQSWYRRRVVWPASVIIAVIGLYWAATRIGG
ncbi:HupE/UreJ family protein [Neorhizobium sp. NPDC001467]|uniref:HupE/UreJ family protein n=1 Tax=Neorhizobium sp. NPDC001467 TaxID=3390595 RepID=UPI003CFEDCD4